MASAGTKAWRIAVLDSGSFEDVLVGTNTGGWMFDDMEHRYTICLLSILKTDTASTATSVRGRSLRFRNIRPEWTYHRRYFRQRASARGQLRRLSQ